MWWVYLAPQNVLSETVLTLGNASSTFHQYKLDRKWSRSKHTLLPSKIRTTHSTKPWKTQRDAERDGANLGWVKQSTQYCQLTEHKQTKEWERYPNLFRLLCETLLPGNLGTHCREWPADETESEMKLIIQENSKPQDLLTYYVRSKGIKDSKERYLSHPLHVIVI